VRRQPSDGDQRAVHLFATANGLAKSAAARPILARFNARMAAGFGEREIATVGRFLNAILQRF
jgi:DNA-binding MarR family transcriptional regulator